MKNKVEFCHLKTPFEEMSQSGWEEYPRPLMKRESYISFCGQWDLFLKKHGEDEIVSLGKITVPYPPESRISGIFREKDRKDKYIYKKTFCVERDFNCGLVYIHFGAVDQICKLSVNSSTPFEHTGGYLPFSFEIGRYLTEGENIIEVEVTDELDTDLAYGKQREKRGGMWYTPTCGIWQPVWLESVPAEHFENIVITPSIDSVTIKTKGGKDNKKLSVDTEDGVQEFEYQGDSVEIQIKNPHNWTPEDPYLYYFTLTDGRDKIKSYFALRTVTVEKRGERDYVCLNGKPYFFHGLLDQGYFSDGIYTPATPEGYKWDILTMKSLGFNMLRKHIKIEPQLFYHYCDKYGMIVFQDMVNSGKYNFIIDTALPTVGMKRGISHRPSNRRKEEFEKSAKATAALLHNHPSVCYYTIFNEGWGQYDSDRIYSEMKRLYPDRVWDSTSGWFFGKLSDVKSEHIYFKKLNMKEERGRPLVISEFGGYSLKVKDHSFNLSKNYGYKTFYNSKELTEGLKNLYLSEVIPEIENKGLCAAVLTQLSDVEDETNGMCTYDRQVIKVEANEMQSIAEALRATFEERIREDEIE